MRTNRIIIILIVLKYQDIPFCLAVCMINGYSSLFHPPPLSLSKRWIGNFSAVLKQVIMKSHVRGEERKRDVAVDTSYLVRPATYDSRPVVVQKSDNAKLNPCSETCRWFWNDGENRNGISVRRSVYFSNIFLFIAFTSRNGMVSLGANGKLWRNFFIIFAVAFALSRNWEIDLLYFHGNTCILIETFTLTESKSTLISSETFVLAISNSNSTSIIASTKITATFHWFRARSRSQKFVKQQLRRIALYLPLLRTISRLWLMANGAIKIHRSWKN